MKIQCSSDLHVEFERNRPVEDRFRLPKTDADVIVLAGDIGVGFKEERKFLEATAQVHGKPIIFVLGNHSFYHGGNIDRIRGRWAQYANEEDTGVYYLDEGFNVTIADVNFIGGIFWTDFNDYNEIDMMVAQRGMNDFTSRMSKLDSGLSNEDYYDVKMDYTSEYVFTPRRSVDEHYKTKEYMDYWLREWKGHKNVVVTHHLPSAKSGDSRYRNSSLNPAYNSNLDDWVMDRDIALWVHGHTHGSNDYMIGDTRVICNPRGYWNYDPNNKFDAEKVVEI